MEMINVSGVTKKYGNTVALDNVSMTFLPGKIYGLLGRNGAGKSTLLKIMTNRTFSDEGVITVNAEQTVENSRLREMLFFMSEENFYGTYKVSKILKYTAIFYPNFDLERAMEYCELFGLNTKKKFSALSTGYKNILKLIIALCQDLPYIVFDEPVVGLDAYHRELFYRLLLKSYGDGDRTFIIATHLIEEIQSLVEEVVILDSGRVLLCDSVENLIQSGYSVAGSPDEVDSYTKDKNIIGTEEISGLKVAYLFEGQSADVPDNLSVSTLSLQKIFVKLTGND